MDKLLKKLSGSETFEVLFAERSLGMEVLRGPRGECIVQNVTAQGEALRLGVQAGDVVAGINGGASAPFDDFVPIVSGLERPLMIAFTRKSGSRPSFLPGGGSSKGVAAASLNGRQPAASAAPLNEEDKRARREAALRAAEERTKAWDNRMKKGKATSARKEEAKGSPVNNTFEASDDQATKAMVDLCKKQETRTAAQLGYNPYAPRLTTQAEAYAAVVGAVAPVPYGLPPAPINAGSGGGSGGASASASGSSSRLSAPSPRRPPGTAGASPSPPRVSAAELATLEVAEEEWPGQAHELEADIDVALGLLMSHEPAVALVAVQTANKLLVNMIAKSQEPKFRRVRLANATFNAKVGSVGGGVELMVAAGFELHCESDEAYLMFPLALEPLPLQLYLATEKLREAEASLSGGAAG